MSATVIPSRPHPASTLRGGLDLSPGVELDRQRRLVPTPIYDPRPRALSVGVISATIAHDLASAALQGAKSNADARGRLDVLLGKVFGAGRLSHRDVAAALRKTGDSRLIALIRPSRQQNSRRHTPNRAAAA